MEYLLIGAVTIGGGVAIQHIALKKGKIIFDDTHVTVIANRKYCIDYRYIIKSNMKKHLHPVRFEGVQVLLFVG